MKLTFWGGAKSVTGANYLLESGATKILVDCGLGQGSNYAEKHNFDPFPYNPAEISAVLVTHAHIDHTGRLPKLCKDGFRGKIYSTEPTRDFAELLLVDSENLLKQEAEKHGREPLYNLDDVHRVMDLWEGIDYHRPFGIGGLEAEFFDAGHILGSSIIAVRGEGKKIVFSGDLGNSPAPIIRQLEKMEEADYCLVESTYGNRLHESHQERREILEDAIEETVKKGGTLMIPAFAMERTQELLYELNELAENGRIPKVPVFIDSPLAIRLTAVYQKHQIYFNSETKRIISSGDAIFNFPGLKMTLTTEQSKEINDVPSPKIIVAGSGMSNGGRILHHEMRYLPDSNSAILFIGYQAKGTLGRQLIEGAASVKIFGEDIPVRCRAFGIGGYSAHADQAQILDWLSPMRFSLKKAFVIQGEEEASGALAVKIRDELAIDAVVPDVGESFEL